MSAGRDVRRAVPTIPTQRGPHAADEVVPGQELVGTSTSIAQDSPAALIGEVQHDLMMVCSSGGHLAQLDSLREWWTGHRTTWVTFPTLDAKTKLRDQTVQWAYYPTTRNAWNAVRNFVLALRLLRRRRPDVVISNGAAVAVPFFVAARLLGIPTVFVEVYDRIDGPTLTGRLCRPLATIFCVQWDEQLQFYPGATVVGGLL